MSLHTFWNRLVGSPLEHDPARYRALVGAIDELGVESAALTNMDLRYEALCMVEQIRAGEPADDRLVRGYALVREAARRTIGLTAYDEQLVAAMAMHDGFVVQMDTGEGKTLAAVFTVFSRAAEGQGAHVLTFNDYLARRDAEWMGPVYEMLGLSVGFIEEGMSPEARRNAYACDVTYLTANECGFDVLRDGLCLNPADRVHRDLHFALVDEADSILIDEARVPLVIAAMDEHRGTLPKQLAALVDKLEQGDDYRVDEYERAVDMSEDGLIHIEDVLGIDLHESENLATLTALNCALHARALLRRDVDYIVRDGAIKLVDEHTGRVAEDRHWPDGLQAALEAKEGLDIEHGGLILGSIPIQHLIRRYQHRCGMTGTAVTAADELSATYGTEVVVVPLHRPCLRDDRHDIVFTHREAKENALLEKIAGIHRTGRPILVGTASVRESERLAAALATEGIDCNVLNAKNDEQEAAIVAEAGAPAALTISTNMAGRGTDIRLGGADEARRDEVVALGGLYVIGTNRHESRRIDDQLRGRAGRQGDPGTSRFFISLEDPLITRFGVKNLIPTRFLPTSRPEPIDHPVVLSEIARTQRIVEGQNTEIRKTLSRYSIHIETQRGLVEDQRREVLTSDAAGEIMQTVDDERFAALEQRLGESATAELCRRIMLLEIDRAWCDHLALVADIREGIHLQRLGRQDPLFVFQKETGLLFHDFQRQVEEASASRFLAIDPAAVDLDADDLKGPSATWTYMINDDPFADDLAKSLAGNVGFSMGAAMVWPLLVLWALAKRWRGQAPR